MPHATLVCPHCEATLKPAKPVGEGKTVKCPKCAKLFKAPEDDEAPVKAKGGTKAKSKPAPVAKIDDDDGDNTYAVVRDPEEEARKAAAEARARRKKRREDEDDEDEDAEDEDAEDEDRGETMVEQYLKNLKSKDPRGPAQEVVVKPSNWLLRTGLMGFFGWAITLIVFMLPVAFPIRPDVEEVDKWGVPIKREEKKEAARKPIFTLDMILLKPLYVVAFVAVFILGMLHAALVANGAVKMYNLESYRWGMTAAILTIFPLHTVPFWYFLWKLLDFMEIYDASYLVAGIILLNGPIVGMMCISVLRRPGVIAGFT